MTRTGHPQMAGFAPEWWPASCRNKWPASSEYARNEQPAVKFEVSRLAIDEFFAASPSNRDLLYAGNFGGVMVGDFPQETVATRFLPQLALRLLVYADAIGINEWDALARIGVQPSFWLVGIA